MPDSDRIFSSTGQSGACQSGAVQSNPAATAEGSAGEPPAAPPSPISREAPAASDGRSAASAIEMVVLSPEGGVFLVGWAADAFDPIAGVRITGEDWRMELPASELARVRRPDLGGAGIAGGAVGFFCLGFGGRSIGCGGPVQVELAFLSGVVMSASLQPRVAESEWLRDLVLTYIGRACRAGEAAIKSGAYLDRGMGEPILRLNRSIVERLAASPYVERFGPAVGELCGSIIVCLYGRPEFLFLQAGLFSGRPGIGDYEFIYVLNSPELAEAVLSEARLAAMIYGLSISVVVMAGNAGFAAANNAASQAARSGRLLFVNPDVFPRDPAWALRHTAVLLSRPTSETALFGGPLFYDNGSLMHGGMWLDLDQGVVQEAGASTAWSLLRVEHHGKGAPPDDAGFTRPRPVTAVSGAFVSTDRGWFEGLGGFSLDYILGHYEDADLCLRSLEAGVASWMHDLRLWHLEGGGSIRRESHDGATEVNRWRFTDQWRDAVVAGGLLGRYPRHPLLAVDE